MTLIEHAEELITHSNNYWENTHAWEKLVLDDIFEVVAKRGAIAPTCYYRTLYGVEGILMFVKEDPLEMITVAQGKMRSILFILQATNCVNTFIKQTRQGKTRLYIQTENTLFYTLFVYELDGISEPVLIQEYEGVEARYASKYLHLLKTPANTN